VKGVVFALAILAMATLAVAARADGAGALSDDAIFGRPAPYLRIESMAMRVTAFGQRGNSGYQSQAGPTVLGPGSERVNILEPQIEVVAKQGTASRTGCGSPSTS